MEFSDIHEKRCDTSDNTTVLYENTVLSVKRNEVEKVEEIEKEEGIYEELRLQSKSVKNKNIPQDADLNRLKIMVYILSALVLVLFIAVIVLIIIFIIFVVPKGDVIDGGWTNWGTWSACTMTCGGGTQIRTRTCTNPKPSDLGEYCIGDPIHIQSCIQERCSPTGMWTKWSDWASCDVTCGNGTQSRIRSCTNPTPALEEAGCTGETVQNEKCSKQLCPVIDGGWTNWGTWSACTVTCGGGTQIRTRTYTNPKPSDLGKYCIGDPIYIQPCSQTECSPIAFSVNSPYSYSIFNGTLKLTFSDTIYQNGGDFDKSTGTFTCSVPGTYHFSVTLVKKRTDTKVDLVTCSLYKSGSVMIRIRIDPTDDDTDIGSAAISQSIVTHLNKNNTVYLSTCIGQPSSYMESWSSFTGFLLFPGN